jgi:hypothetical protein
MLMRPAESTASSKGDASLAASIGGYLGILVVTVGATLITAASGLGDEYRPPEQMVSSAITVAAVAAVLVAAISAGAFLYTRRPPSYWLWLPALVVSAGLVIAVVLLAHHGTTDAVHYWQSPTPTGDAGNGWWKVAALIAFACPYVAIALTAFRTGAARIFVLVAGLTSLAWLAAEAFDQVARANI